MTTLEGSYRRCRSLTQASGTTYYWSTFVLPAVKRHHVHALYGFCRYADDIVDDVGPAPAEERSAALAELGDRFLVSGNLRTVVLDLGSSSDVGDQKVELLPECDHIVVDLKK